MFCIKARVAAWGIYMFRTFYVCVCLELRSQNNAVLTEEFKCISSMKHVMNVCATRASSLNHIWKFEANRWLHAWPDEGCNEDGYLVSLPVLH
jgi:hypothetical protein